MRYFFAIVFYILFVTSCSSTSNNTWTGSVDAVFRYRPSESSTVVHEVRKGSYSEASGLKVGDQILAVDGEDVSNVDYKVVRNALRGPVGTFASLTVKRGEKIMEVKVERMPIKEE